MTMKCPHCGGTIPAKLIAQEMGKAGGSKTSAAKRRASRLNGMKGGRPPKKGKKRQSG